MTQTSQKFDYDAIANKAEADDRRAWQTLPTGALLSAAFAGAGAVLWFLLAYYARFEIGWLAWIIGGLAGAGFVVGSGRQNLFNGILAALIAIGAIVVGKRRSCRSRHRRPSRSSSTRR